jgi:hypothetical protein
MSDFISPSEIIPPPATLKDKNPPAFPETKCGWQSPFYTYLQNFLYGSFAIDIPHEDVTDEPKQLPQ